MATRNYYDKKIGKLYIFLKKDQALKNLASKP